MTVTDAIRIGLAARDIDSPVTVTCRDGVRFTGDVHRAHNDFLILNGDHGQFGIAMGDIRDLEITNW